jgi:hypothetical protein
MAWALSNSTNSNNDRSTLFIYWGNKLFLNIYVYAQWSLKEEPLAHSYDYNILTFSSVRADEVVKKKSKEQSKKQANKGRTQCKWDPLSDCSNRSYLSPMSLLWLHLELPSLIATLKHFI